MEGSRRTVSKICQVPISIGKFYKDDVAFEVVDIDASHVLLGRPWKYDVDATHTGVERITIYLVRKVRKLPSFLKKEKLASPTFP